MNYFALIASLPALRRDETPFYTTDAFLLACSNNVPEDAFKRLSALHLLSDVHTAGFSKNSLAAKYLNWEVTFRNAIARIRAAKLSRDPSAFLHADGDWQSDADRAAAEAYTAQNPLEREQKLDDARWNKISEFETGCLFHYDLLCAYKLKLEILEKWSARKEADSSSNLDLAASEIRHGASPAN